MHSSLIEHAAWLIRDRLPIGRTYQQLKNARDLVSPGFAACTGCNAELSLRLTLKVLGDNLVMAIPAGCMGGCAPGYGRDSAMKVTTMMPLMDNTAAMAAGLKRAFRRQGKDALVVAFAGDGATGDIGLQCLSAAAERRENLIYICYDNEGYMNTGVQRSGTTPQMAQTTTTPVSKHKHGKLEPAKELPLIMAMNNATYVATATTAYPADFAHKLRKAAAVRNGLAYIHLFSPCPVGWLFPPEKTIEVARLAVETRHFPLWEAEDGSIRLTRKVAFPKPVKDYLKLLGKFKHLTEREIKEIQEQVDRRYRRLMSLVK